MNLRRLLGVLALVPLLILFLVPVVVAQSDSGVFGVFWLS